MIGGLALGRLFVKEPTSRYVAFLAGWGALRVIALIPFLGGIAWLVGTVLELGTLWVAARAPREVRRVAPPITPFLASPELRDRLKELSRPASPACSSS